MEKILSQKNKEEIGIEISNIFENMTGWNYCNPPTRVSFKKVTENILYMKGEMMCGTDFEDDPNEPGDDNHPIFDFVAKLQKEDNEFHVIDYIKDTDDWDEIDTPERQKLLKERYNR